MPEPHEGGRAASAPARPGAAGGDVAERVAVRGGSCRAWRGSDRADEALGEGDRRRGANGPASAHLWASTDTQHGRVVRVEKRRNPSRIQKQQGIVDGWYVDADENGREDRWIFEAVRGTDVADWPDGEHPCEALGPSIQGNPLGLATNVCVPFNLSAPVLGDVPRSYDGLREFLLAADSRFSPGHLAEGIVFHHPDGRRAKIKGKDFSKS
jgi:hypothetical protein